MEYGDHDATTEEIDGEECLVQGNMDIGMVREVSDLYDFEKEAIGINPYRD
ncbi:MAG: hypothetical protein ABEJ72_04070 [Candidatus Aenigmatarchaeota archaeon]